VAIVEDGRPKVLPNKQGYTTTPSVIAQTAGGERLVGQIAIRQQITNAADTVHAAKRLIGRPWGSTEVEHARIHFAYEIVEGPHGDVRIILGGKPHSVPELSAMLLTEMRLIAEDYLEERVDRAVITVPAYFDDAQRQAVRDAGRIAGLDVLRILNEPTAAALAYGFTAHEVAKTVVVYDLGGGTFDVSIVEIATDGELRVVATTGDSYLGGEDFDDRLMDMLMWTVGQFETDHGVDVRATPTAVSRLREASHKAKTELSAVESTTVSLPVLAQSPAGEPLHLERTITRTELESITQDLVSRTLEICQIGLEYAELDRTQIDEVILVGGQTRMPAVQRAVAGYFGREPVRGVHPDEVVALGAAIAADALAQGEEALALHDVTAHSLGIMTAGGRFDALIRANSPTPARETSVFSTSRDGQKTVNIVVFQGESEIARENRMLGRFALNELREAPAGEVEIEVTFAIDRDGIFNVAARDLETGHEASIEVLASSGLTENEISEMSQESAEYLAARREEEATEALRQSLGLKLEDIRRKLPQAEARVATNAAGQMALAKAKQIVAQIENDVERADWATLEEHRALLTKVAGTLDKVLA
jgi:molecular chaperone DnaK